MKRIITIVLMAVLFIAGCTNTVYIYVTPEPTTTEGPPSDTVPVELTPTPTEEPAETPTPTALPTPTPTVLPTPTTITTIAYSYSWFIGNWTTCSLACGGGTQDRTVFCQRNDFAIGSDSFCPSPKPATMQVCNTQPCPTPTPTPTPTATPTAPPVLLNITWLDTDNDDVIDDEDYLVFTFSNPMYTSNMDFIVEINIRLARNNNAFGSDGPIAWSENNTVLTVELSPDCALDLASHCYNPTDDVRDIYGNADATADCVWITQ